MLALVRYIKKAIQIGPRRTLQVFDAKVRTSFFEYRWRNLAVRKQAQHTWHAIGALHKGTDLFPVFFSCVRRRSSFFVERSLHHDWPSCIAKADQYVDKMFGLLGAHPQRFENMPWHIDIRLQQNDPAADCTFDDALFYKDIIIQIGQQANVLEKDIKVPWELSRCQHLVLLGIAYHKTNRKQYAQAFADHITDWIQSNPYMLGVNWACPMEVGLRALNWIIAAHYFFDAHELDERFWELFSCSLYDHLHYLEHNWEIYDGRTSNHYLSDLVGYLYLTDFFDLIPGMDARRAWCFEQIVKECDKQVFDEGTSYEGSTSYHNLVTELFMHAYCVAHDAGMSIPSRFRKKLDRMLSFITWCSYADGSMVSIGDNDSGCVTLLGILYESSCITDHALVQGYKQFPCFGISILKTDRIHATLRHHAYQKDQPSGHFHNDVGSITLAVDGVPVIVDPGSYVYTPSQSWRNYFRSAHIHNNVSVHNHEPVLFDEQLFRLSMPTAQKNEYLLCADERSFFAENTLYNRLGLSIKRSIMLSQDAKIFAISDVWNIDQKVHSEEFLLSSNFTFSPDINIEELEQGRRYVLVHAGLPLVIMESDQPIFQITTGWVSPAYGVKRMTSCLRALFSCHDRNALRITVEIL